MPLGQALQEGKDGSPSKWDLEDQDDNGGRDEHGEEEVFEHVAPERRISQFLYNSLMLPRAWLGFLFPAFGFVELVQVEKPVGAAVGFPVKVLTGITVAFEFFTAFGTSRTVGEWDVVVSDIVEEMDFTAVEHQTSSNGVDRSVAPSLVEETTVLIERGEVVDVGLAAKPVEVSNFKVGPEVTFVVCFTTVITQPFQRVVLVDMLGMSLHKFLDTVP